MKQLKSERGYTLVLVLLVVTLLLSFSAMFIATSMNHSTQERTIESGNQAVAVAEMGVEYYSLTVEKQINEAFIEVRDTVIIPGIRDLTVCLEKGGQYKDLMCSDQREFNASISKIVNHSEMKYYDLISNFYPEDATELRKISKKNLDLEGTLPAFYLNNYSVTSSDLSEEIKLNLNVIGETPGESRNLESTIHIKVPDFIYFVDDDNTPNDDFITRDVYEVLFSWPIPTQSCLEPDNYSGDKPYTLSPPYNCYLNEDESFELLLNAPHISNNLFPKLNVYVKDFGNAVCPGVKCNSNNLNLRGLTLYVGNSAEDISVVEGNINNLSNFTLVQEGMLELSGNANNASANLIVGSISAEGNLNNIDGYFLVMGNDKGTGVFDFANINFKTSSNGKVCLNLDGLGEVRGNYNNNGSDGELIYYSTKGESFNGGTQFDDQKSLEEFVEYCTGRDVDLTEFIGNLPSIGTDNAEVDIKVEY